MKSFVQEEQRRQKKKGGPPEGVVGLPKVPDQAQPVRQRPRARQRSRPEAALAAPPPLRVAHSVVDRRVRRHRPLLARAKQHAVDGTRQVAARGVAPRRLAALHCGGSKGGGRGQEGL